MGPLEIALGAAALLIGLTGAWSPCGFSMVETIGPTGHTGGRRTTLAACATFTPGSIVGGVATFGVLALLGALAHGAGGQVAYLVAAVIALAAAIAEARGTRIVPQIRRQLPEHWRRVMPMPVAAALYGVLLGLGFATFVLSFGVWALAGISFAVGDPTTGVVIGAGFGIGRAIPIALLAPVAGKPLGTRVTELMAERPGIYRGFRFGDALALLLAAAALTTTGTATAARTETGGAADPSYDAGELAFQLNDRSGILRRNGQRIRLPGTDPAVGGPYVAVINGNSVQLLDRRTLTPISRIPVTNPDAVAVSGRWLAHRTRTRGRDTLAARRITNPQRPGVPKRIARARRPSQLGRPSLDGDRVVYAVATKRRNRIVQRFLGSSKRRTLISSRTDALSNASVLGRRLLFIKSDGRRDRLVMKKIGGRGNGDGLFSRRRGYLWSTDLAGRRAYVTHVGGGTRILSVRR